MDYKYIFCAMILVIACCSTGKAQQKHGQSTHADFLQAHKYSVGQASFTIIDSSRNRPLKTEVWYPTMDTSRFNLSGEYPFQLPPTSKEAEIVAGKHPLILMSHGTGGNRISLMWLACELAANGYIVAAVDHFGNTFDNKIPENFVKVWDRPMDISFLLSYLLEASLFSPNINSRKIGMVGFSLGGYTALALAGAEIDHQALYDFSKTKQGKRESQLPELGDVSKLITPSIIAEGNQKRDLKDPRISTFVALAPAIGQGVKSEAQVQRIDQPVLIIGAAQDKRAPLETNANHYQELITNAEYLVLEGQVGHYVFLNEAKSYLEKEAPIYFRDHSKVSRRLIHEKVAAAVLEFNARSLGFTD